jgi:DNA helicase-2/ATP-dependent DNA helicase PcrA
MFDYIQIDEAQDLSEKQYDLLKLLRTNNIVLVADDDQSIYGFRGAKPDLLFDFEHAYHNCKRFLLEENYRSDYIITGISSEIIKSNKTRFKKNFYTRNIRSGKIILKRFSDTEKQAAETSKLILSNYQAGKSVCVLYRNNASLICPLVSLIMDINRRKKDFPDVVIKGELPDAKEIDLIFDIFCDVNDDIHTAELKIFNYGFSGKRRFHINCLKSAAMILGNSFHTELSLKKLYEQIKNIGLVKSEKNTGKIFFSTIHSAKGLEFDTVIVIDLVEGELPSVDSKDESAIEEERRLAYVAITRAKSKVYMFYPEKNFKTIQKKSRFLDETQKAMQTYY